MVRTWRFHCQGLDSIPGRELRSHKLCGAAIKNKKQKRIMEKYMQFIKQTRYVPNTSGTLRNEERIDTDSSQKRKHKRLLSTEKDVHPRKR